MDTQHEACLGSMTGEHGVYSETLNGVDIVEWQDVDLTVLLTLHSYVKCQTGVCVCEYPVSTKVSVLNPYITGLKRKVNNYKEQMSLLLMDLMCIWFNEHRSPSTGLWYKNPHHTLSI